MKLVPTSIEKEKLLAQIIAQIQYNDDPIEDGFVTLTAVRYTDTTSINAAYLCSYDGNQVFKLTCEEVDSKDINNVLSEKELSLLNEQREIYLEESAEYEEDEEEEYEEDEDSPD